MIFDSPTDAIPALVEAGNVALPSTAELALQRDAIRTEMRGSTCPVRTTHLRIRMLGIEDAMRRSNSSAGEGD